MAEGDGLLIQNYEFFDFLRFRVRLRSFVDLPLKILFRIFWNREVSSGITVCFYFEFVLNFVLKGDGLVNHCI